MIVLTLLLLSTLALCSSDLVLDNNQFFFENRQYHKAKLCQYGNMYNNVGTCEKDHANNHLWLLDPHPTKAGCYYLVNDKYNTRLAYHKTEGLVVASKGYKDTQLFSFKPSSDGFYYIYSCYYTGLRISHYGPKPTDNGFADKKRPLKPTQEWKLVPRFTASVSTEEIFHFDNLQGSQAISREVTVATGIEMSSSKEVRNMESFKQSMTASLGGKGAKVESSTEFTSEIETTITSSSTESWSNEETMTYTIPPGKNFKLMQHVTTFTGVIPEDTATMKTAIKLFESDSEEFTDPSGFIISS